MDMKMTYYRVKSRLRLCVRAMNRPPGRAPPNHTLSTHNTLRGEANATAILCSLPWQFTSADAFRLTFSRCELMV